MREREREREEMYMYWDMVVAVMVEKHHP